MMALLRGVAAPLRLNTILLATCLPRVIGLLEWNFDGRFFSLLGWELQ